MSQAYKIPEKFKNSDTVYHYTSLRTAIEHILPTMKLRFSPRKHSNDPVENLGDIFSTSHVGHNEPSSSLRDHANEVRERFIGLTNRTKQICFCKNPEISRESQTIYPAIEEYGFCKPRMWEQYGNNYEGVCLVFSLSKLEEALPNKTFYKTNNLNYVGYSEINRSHVSLDMNTLAKIGIHKYYPEFEASIKERLFLKHQDYSGENEYRILSFKESQYDFLDVSEALLGVIVSHTDNNQSLFKTLERQLKGTAPLYLISFLKENIHFESYIAYKALHSSIENSLKNKFDTA